MSGAALEAEGLCKAFGGLAVTRDVSLVLPRGARHALIGPNGAGKSTLVGLLSGVLSLDAGRVRVSGRDLTHASPAQRVRGGLVRSFQVSSLFAGLTALENTFLAVSAQARASYRVWRPARRERGLIERARAVLDDLGLACVADRRADELAYGQQRLLDIAVALASDPKVLLLDEPTAGIPSAETGLILDALERLPADIAILLIEHDMQVVRRFASAVTVLVEGSVLLTGAPGAVMEADEVRAVYLGTSGRDRFLRERAHA